MHKTTWLLVIIMMAIAIALTGCQSSESPTELPEVTEQPPGEAPPGQETEQAYPPPGDAYPPPQQIQPVYNPYPGPSEGVTNYVEWSEAELAIMNGEVLEVYQAQTLHVTLVLVNGKVILVAEPEIDAVFDLIDRCGDPCKDVLQVTE